MELSRLQWAIVDAALAVWLLVDAIAYDRPTNLPSIAVLLWLGLDNWNARGD